MNFSRRILRPVNDFDVDVRLIDVGTIVRSKSTEIFELNERFCDFPRQAIDLHLIGLIPADSEDEWDSELTSVLDRDIKQTLSRAPDAKIEANIVFALQNHIAVDCLRITETKHGVVVVKKSIKRHMIEKGWGKASIDAKNSVIKMAHESGKCFRKRVKGCSSNVSKFRRSCYS